jgi:hypothetical protein
MPYALYLNDHKISGPFSEKSEAWADATKRGLVTVIPSLDEDPPRRILDLNYSIRSAVDRSSPVVSTFPSHTNGIGPHGDHSILNA